MASPALKMLQTEICRTTATEQSFWGLVSFLGAITSTLGVRVEYLILPSVSLLPLRFRWSQSGKLFTSNKIQSLIFPAGTSL